MVRKAVLILLALLVALPISGILPQGKVFASPDTVTYWWDSQLGAQIWDNDPAYMYDGILTNYAYTSSDGDTEYLNGNTCPGTDLGTITKVEIRCYGYGDGNDRIDLQPQQVLVGEGNEHELTMPAIADWSAYADITNDPNMPDPWTWTIIANTLAVTAEKDNVGKGNQMNCSKVEIRVTYTPEAVVLPTVTTQAATDIEDTTATGNGNITNTGGENCDIRGIVWDLASHGDPGNTSPGASDYANDVAETNGFGTGAFTRSLTGLPTGDTIYARAYAHNTAGYAYGDEVSFLTKPAAPTNVAAEDGISTENVTVTWTKSTGATGYKVYEGANLLDTLGDVATYDDTTAPAGSITSAGNVTASDGTQTAHVVLSLANEATANGASRTYKVVAFNATGDSDDSAADTGYRGVGAITYQWQRSAADSDAGYGNIGGATTDPYNDTAAPAGAISNSGNVTASDGTSSDYVTLSLANEATTDGAGRYYQCIVSATGASNSPQTSDNDRGYRTVGTITYQWQRSSADADADYSNIAGGTTDPYNDTGAPADGSGRYFQCIVSSVDASNTPQTSDNDRGYRAVAPVAPPAPSEILPEAIPLPVGIGHLAWFIPMVIFSVLAFWMCNGLLFMLAGGSSLMMGFTWYDIFTTNLGMSVGLLLVAYSIVCLVFALGCLFKRGVMKS